MTTLLVTSTDNGTGKTAIGVALARLGQRRDASVGYMKPIGTRLESVVGKTRDADPALARDHLGLDDAVPDLEPIVYSPTFVRDVIRGREDPDELRDRVRERFDSLAAGRDVVIVEGSGRIQTGEIADLTDADVADLLDAQVVLVSSYEDSRDLDDVLAAADRLGDRLAGVLFNGVSGTDVDELTEDVSPFLAGRGVETLGVVPYDETLAGRSVESLAEEIGADVVTSDAPTDGLVERFVVGATGSGGFGRIRQTRRAAVLTGGEQSDVQTVALESPGVACLVLTGGYRPSSAVVGTAEEHGVPLLLVQTDTRTTIDRLTESLQSGRIRDPDAVERMAELLSETVDFDGLLGRPNG